MIYIDDRVIEDVAKGFHVPVKPEILTRLQHVMSKRESSIRDEALVIEQDVALSSAILKTINTPYFGLSRKVSDIQQAVCFMGMDIVNDLITALLFKSAFDKIPCCLSLERFWDNASDVANVMTFIEKNLSSQLPKVNLYTMGLFHDCGIPAFASKYQDYKETLIQANNERVNSIALEEEKYGSNHAIVGYYIASSWQLPKQVCNIILNHHDLTFLKTCTDTTERIGYAGLKLAENLTDRNRRHCESPDWQHVQKDVLHTLGLSYDDYLELENNYQAIAT